MAQQEEDLVHLPSELSRIQGIGFKMVTFIPQLLTCMTYAVELDIEAKKDTDCNHRSSFHNPMSRSLSILCILWVFLSYVIVAGALVDTVCRQLLWYKLLDYGIIMDFEGSNMLQRIRRDEGIFTLGIGYVIFLCNAFVNGPCSEEAKVGPLDIFGFVTSGFIAVLLPYIFFVTEAEASQLPTINDFIHLDREKTIQFLSDNRHNFLPESLLQEQAEQLLDDAVYQDQNDRPLSLVSEKSLGRWNELAWDGHGGAGQPAKDSEGQKKQRQKNPKRRWAMQFLGFAPFVGLLQWRLSPTRPWKLLYWPRDRRFSAAEEEEVKHVTRVRVWYLIALIAPGLVIFQNVEKTGWFISSMFTVYILFVLSPSVVLWLSPRNS